MEPSRVARRHVVAAELVDRSARLIDRFGVRWQIVPRALDEMMRDGNVERAKRVADAMLKMVKLDVAALEKAYRSKTA